MIKLLDIIATTPGLEYHIKHKLPISENVYRYSSNFFIELFEEARQLRKTGMLELLVSYVNFDGKINISVIL